METERITQLVVSILLAINAYFIRNLVQSLNDVKLELARLLTAQTYTQGALDNLDSETKDLYEKYGKLSTRVATLEANVKELKSS